MCRISEQWHLLWVECIRDWFPLSPFLSISFNLSLLLLLFQSLPLPNLFSLPKGHVQSDLSFDHLLFVKQGLHYGGFHWWNQNEVCNNWLTTCPRLVDYSSSNAGIIVSVDCQELSDCPCSSIRLRWASRFFISSFSVDWVEPPLCVRCFAWSTFRADFFFICDSSCA